MLEVREMIFSKSGCVWIFFDNIIMIGGIFRTFSLIIMNRNFGIIIVGYVGYMVNFVMVTVVIMMMMMMVVL